MSETAVSVKRIVTIYSSQGKNNNPIEFEGTLWGELRSVLSANGYNIGSMKAIENIRKSTLENPKALLPVGDFNLHLFPVKTKSGADRKEIFAIVKQTIEAFGQKAKDHFNEGKNYTNKSTPEVETLLAKWNKKYAGKTPPPAPVKAAKVSKAPAKEEPKGKLNKAGTKVEVAAPKKAAKKEATKAAVKKGTEKTPVFKAKVSEVVESVKESKSETKSSKPKSDIEILVTSKVNLELIKGHPKQANVVGAIENIDEALKPKEDKKMDFYAVKSERNQLKEGAHALADDYLPSF